MSFLAEGRSFGVSGWGTHGSRIPAVRYRQFSMDRAVTLAQCVVAERGQSKTRLCHGMVIRHGVVLRKFLVDSASRICILHTTGTIHGNSIHPLDVTVFLFARTLGGNRRELATSRFSDPTGRQLRRNFRTYSVLGRMGGKGLTLYGTKRDRVGCALGMH